MSCFYVGALQSLCWRAHVDAWIGDRTPCGTKLRRSLSVVLCL